MEGLEELVEKIRRHNKVIWRARQEINALVRGVEQQKQAIEQVLRDEQAELERARAALDMVLEGEHPVTAMMLVDDVLFAKRKAQLAGQVTLQVAGALAGQYQGATYYQGPLSGLLQAQGFSAQGAQAQGLGQQALNTQVKPKP